MVEKKSQEVQDNPSIDKIWRDRYPDITGLTRNMQLRILKVASAKPELAETLVKLNGVERRQKERYADLDKREKRMRDWGTLN